MMYKVNKTVARKLFNQGKTISLYPCKANIHSKWIEPFTIQKDAIANTMPNQSDKTIDFDKIVNNFEAYNCNYELGMYAAYYVHRG